MDTYILAISIACASLGAMCMFVLASFQADIREIRAQAMENATAIARLESVHRRTPPKATRC